MIYLFDLYNDNQIIVIAFQYYLQMDGRGLFQFNKIDSDTEEFGS